MGHHKTRHIIWNQCVASSQAVAYLQSNQVSKVKILSYLDFTLILLSVQHLSNSSHIQAT